MTPTDAITDALAVARLSRLARKDTIADDLRYAFVTHRLTRGWGMEFIRCPWCVSMWCALLVSLLRATCPTLWAPLSRALAASYVASMSAVHLEERADH